VKRYLAMVVIALPTLAFAQISYLIGQRIGTSANGQAVKICSYAGREKAQLEIEPFASCPPSVGGSSVGGSVDYTGGYSAGMNAQSQRALQNAQTKLLETQTRAAEAQTRALQQANMDDRPRAAPSAMAPQQREWADQWKRLLQQSLDSCGSGSAENSNACQRAATRAYGNAIACNSGDRDGCSARDKALAASEWLSPERWANWLKESLEFCGDNERCKRVATRSYADNIDCAQGNRLACDQIARDVTDWDAEKRVP
jgi:hypothetical protein